MKGIFLGIRTVKNSLLSECRQFNGIKKTKETLIYYPEDISLNEADFKLQSFLQGIQ